MNKQIERRKDWYQSIELPERIIEACGTGSRPMRDMDRRWELMDDRIVWEGASVLDIGCAEGAFLCRAGKNGAGSLCGVELDKTRRARTKDNLEAWELNKATVVPEISPWKQKTTAFDVVFCFSMLHYVRRIFGFLDDVCEKTKGVLFFEFAVQPTTQDDRIEYRREGGDGLILPWWLLRDRMESFGDIEVISDPNSEKVGRRVFGCLRR